MFPWPYDNTSFVEPHHQHDLTAIRHLSQPPRDLLPLLPNDFLSMIIQVQDATSIVYASWKRLDQLFRERREHIFAVPGIVHEEQRKIEYSEPAFFYYRNQVEAERSYLLFEALVDWQSKLSRLEQDILFVPLLHLLKPTFESEDDDDDEENNSRKARTNATESLLQWLTSLNSEVLQLRNHAERTHVPDFERTIAEFEQSIADDGIGARAMRRKTRKDEKKKAAELDRRDSGIGLDEDIEKVQISGMVSGHGIGLGAGSLKRGVARRDSGIEMLVTAGVMLCCVYYVFDVEW